MTKITAKGYMAIIEEKNIVQRIVDNFWDLVRREGGQIMSKEVETAQVSLKKIEAKIMELPTVTVSYCIGSRSYYDSVIKIGKSYFCHSRKMTAGRGYRCIKEIEKITDKMHEEMVSDSYWY